MLAWGQTAFGTQRALQGLEARLLQAAEAWPAALPPCSTACQRKDWPNHKPNCKKAG